MRVFVVDDEKEIVRIFGRVLHLQRLHRCDDVEIEIHSETNGALGLARLLSDEEFDLTFLDVMLPDVSGVDIYARLVRDAPGRLGRIVIITGGAYIPATMEFLRTSRLPYLEKPFSLEVIEQTILSYRNSTLPRGP
jgi:CheY-like chemotaxis protein